MLGILAGAAIACGTVVEGDGVVRGKNDEMPIDAGGDVGPDAAIDAPPVTGLIGLGQKCELANNGADCPTMAPQCVKITGATTSYCSPLCLNAAHAFGVTGGFRNISPAPDHAVCAAQYAATVGAGECDVVTRWLPADTTIIVDKDYYVDMTCKVACGSNDTCPATMKPFTNAFGCHCVPI
jgi:hypothetical protein